MSVRIGSGDGQAGIRQEAEAAQDAWQETPVCRKLRTKLAFSAMVTPDGEAVRWQKGDGSTAIYWCLATMECAGPDDGLVHAQGCRPGRGCYQSLIAAESPHGPQLGDGV